MTNGPPERAVRDLSRGAQLRAGGLVPPQTGGAVHFVQMLFCKKSESVLVHDKS